jgi:putative DNA primase/helicase
MYIHNSDVSLPCARELNGRTEAKIVSETFAQPDWREMNWFERFLQMVGIVLGIGDDFLSLVTAATIKPKRLKWLWPNRVPLGKLTLFVGNPDNGKSMVAIDVAARVTTAQSWYDAKNTLPESNVLIFGAEDDPEDTTVPRLIAAGANRNRIHFAKMTSDNPNALPEEREMRLDEDIDALRIALKQNPSIRLVVIDPISNYLGDTKMNEEQNVRRVLTPLQALASESGVAVLGIMHLNKKPDQQGINRIGGAMAFVGVARAVWLFAADHDDPNLFDMVRVKNNICQRGGGLLFGIATKPVEIEGDFVEQPYVEWCGITDKSADDMLAAKAIGRPRDKRDEGLEWLRQLLSDGPKPAKEVEARCEAEGFSYRTLERAKNEAEVRSFKKGETWHWERIDVGRQIHQTQDVQNS